MFFADKTKDVGYDSGEAAQAAQNRMGGVGTVVKSDTTEGRWLHKIPFKSPVLEVGKLNEDVDSLAKHYGVTTEVIVGRMSAGLDLYARTLVNDGKDPVATAKALREKAEAEILQWTMESGNFTYMKDMNGAFQSGGTKAKAAWLDEFVSADKAAPGAWKNV